MDNESCGDGPNDCIGSFRRLWWLRFIDDVKRKAHERKAKKEQESPADRAARTTAAATVWMARFSLILTVVSAGTLWILKNQLAEMNDDRRPWVGLELLPCKEANTCEMTTDNTLIIDKLSAVVTNSGRSPAIDIVVTSLEPVSLYASDPIPTFDSRAPKGLILPTNMTPNETANLKKAFASFDLNNGPPRDVLAPNGKRTINIVENRSLNREEGTRLEREAVIYVLVKITYHDTFSTTEHDTLFCVKNDFQYEFRSCATGNEMH